MPAVTVYLHTNSPQSWRNPPAGSGFTSVIAGSVNGSELGGNLSAVEARWGGCCIRSPWNLPSAYKYDWMMGVSASSRRSDKSWLGLLADTDILFQCTASEFNQTASNRRKKVEMLFAHLKRILGLARLRLRGPYGVQDEFTLAATAQNLRKLAKLMPMGPAAG